MTSLLPAPRSALDPLGAPPLPAPRGPVSAALLAHLERPPGRRVRLPRAGDDPLWGDDAALALTVCYELHYQGFAGVDPRWEWDPHLLRARAGLEAALEERLLDVLAAPSSGIAPPARVVSPTGGMSPGEVGEALVDLARGGDGPSLSRFADEEGTLDQLREFAVHRSIYQRKEADPHTWGIPRLVGGPKAALVHIQHGEYGEGRPDDVHAELFAVTLRALGLDDGYLAYLDHVPGVTLATVNLVSLFGLHRRWRGALAGHLALFEMSSVGPMGRYASALTRLGLPPEATRFYATHVEADADHEVVALHDLAIGLARREPELASDIVLGARALSLVEERFADHLLGAWSRGDSSLRRPLVAGPTSRQPAAAGGVP